MEAGKTWPFLCRNQTFILGGRSPVSGRTLQEPVYAGHLVMNLAAAGGLCSVTRIQYEAVPARIYCILYAGLAVVNLAVAGNFVLNHRS